MSTKPRVSFVVLSYNNDRFVRECLDSIFKQNFEDFEIILIDDASTDNSVNIAKSYTDDRLKVFIHEKNLGLTPSYNEAITRSQGDFIVNLDSDDAIHPLKTEKQLAVFGEDPTLDVVGTYINLIDEHGQPHPSANIIEGLTNKPHNFNEIRTWVVQNFLVRSSTMMRSSLHDRVGLNQLGMVRAPDYDLWTRALRSGSRFHVIPESLTNYRQHSRGLTYGDPHTTFLELSYSLIQHILPLIDARADYMSLADSLGWMTQSEEFARLGQRQRYRLLALMFQPKQLASYEDFRSYISLDEDDEDTLLLGRRVLAAQTLHRSIRLSHSYLDGIEWQKQQIENWRAAFEHEAEQARNWKAAFEHEAAQARVWKAALDHQIARSAG